MSGQLIMTNAGKNASWIALAQAAKITFQLTSIVVLTRLLPPDDFGIMAMATVVINFALLFRDMGTASAIIQRNEIDELDISSLFWMNALFGVLVGLALVSTAGTIAEYYNSPRLANVLHLLSPIFPVMALASVHQAVLERGSNFRTLATIDIVASCAGLATAVVAAVMGYGVYSLVFQAIVSSLLTTTAIIIASATRIKMRLDLRRIYYFLHFSGNLFAFNLINYFSRNADSLIIGRVLGPAALGVYSLSYRVLLFPLQNITGISSRALYPILSRQQATPQAMADLYLKSVSVVLFLSAPMMVGAFVLRDPLVDLVFGKQWSSVSDLIYWMAPVGLIQSLTSTTGTVFMARGRTDILMRLGAVGAILQVSAFLVGVRWGVEGVAKCYLVANLLNAIPCLAATVSQLDTTVSALVSRVIKPLLLSATMGATIYWAREALHMDELDPLTETAALTGLGAGIYLALALVFARSQLLLLLSSFRRA
jgi:O-antigen/teichoic acid export membrane protein